MVLPLAWIGPDNLVIIGIIALLLFGKRLPEVGRSLGKGIIEFKKGLAGIEEDINQTVQSAKDASPNRAALPSAYKFDPYTGKPLNEEPAPTQMRYDPYTGKPLSEPSGSRSTSSNT